MCVTANKFVTLRVDGRLKSASGLLLSVERIHVSDDAASAFGCVEKTVEVLKMASLFKLTKRQWSTETKAAIERIWLQIGT